MSKNRNNSRRNPSKSDRLQGYKMGLAQKSVSETVDPSYSTFDETTNLASDSYEYFNVPRELKSKTPSSKLQVNWNLVAVVIGIIVAFGGAAYRFGILEKSVEIVQNSLAEIRIKIEKIEESQKKDYQNLNDKLINNTQKNGK